MGFAGDFKPCPDCDAEKEEKSYGINPKGLVYIALMEAAEKLMQIQLTKDENIDIREFLTEEICDSLQKSLFHTKEVIAIRNNRLVFMKDPTIN